MINEVPISLLKPHPKNAYYYSPPSSEEREALKRSIAAEGIRDPLKVTPDYTVIAGHFRLEVAKELGLEKAPVAIVDGDQEYLEYLLIADNDERRQCQDPMRKARRAEFLKRYWGVRESAGRPGKLGQNVLINSGNTATNNQKTLADVAEAIGEDYRTTQRLLKLNNLIPSLQQLVSQGKLSQTAAYSLAFLPPEEQERLLAALGESGICGLSVRQAQELRRALEEARRAAEEAQARLIEAERRLAEVEKGSSEAERLREEIEALRRENEELRARGTVERVVERVVEVPVEKVVVRPDPALRDELEAVRKDAARKEARIRELEAELERLAGSGSGKLQALRDEIKRLQAEKKLLEMDLKKRRPASILAEKFRKLVALMEKEEAEIAELVGKCDLSQFHYLESRRWAATFRRFAEYVERAVGENRKTLEMEADAHGVWQ